MENSYKYFENRACKYYPCHKGIEEMNCLFCYCPMYRFQKCPGKPAFITAGEKEIKDCSACTFPHQAENYEKIMQFLRAHK
jgi:Zn-finger protein